MKTFLQITNWLEKRKEEKPIYEQESPKLPHTEEITSNWDTGSKETMRGKISKKELVR